MQAKDVFPKGTRNVPQITYLNVQKLNRIGFVRDSSITLDLKYSLRSMTAKRHSNSAAIRFFYANIDNGMWGIATVTMQCRNS